VGDAASAGGATPAGIVGEAAAWGVRSTGPGELARHAASMLRIRHPVRRAIIASSCTELVE